MAVFCSLGGRAMGVCWCYFHLLPTCGMLGKHCTARIEHQALSSILKHLDFRDRNSFPQYSCGQGVVPAAAWSSRKVGGCSPSLPLPGRGVSGLQQKSSGKIIPG